MNPQGPETGYQSFAPPQRPGTTGGTNPGGRTPGLWTVVGGACAVVALLTPVGKHLWDQAQKEADFHSKAKHIAAADRECAAARAAISRFGQPDIADSRAYASFLRQIIPVERQLIVRWAAIPTPKGDRGKVTKIITYMRQSSNELAEAAMFLEKEDVQTANRSMTRAKEYGQRAQQGALVYGYRICSDL